MADFYQRPPFPVLGRPSIRDANPVPRNLRDNVGPILAGVARPAHVLTQSATVGGIINMSAIAVVDALEYAATRDAAEDRARQD